MHVGDARLHPIVGSESDTPGGAGPFQGQHSGIGGVARPVLLETDTVVEEAAERAADAGAVVVLAGPFIEPPGHFVEHAWTDRRDSRPVFEATLEVDDRRQTEAGTRPFLDPGRGSSSLTGQVSTYRVRTPGWVDRFGRGCPARLVRHPERIPRVLWGHRSRCIAFVSMNFPVRQVKPTGSCAIAGQTAQCASPAWYRRRWRAQRPFAPPKRRPGSRRRRIAEAELRHDPFPGAHRVLETRAPAKTERAAHERHLAPDLGRQGAAVTLQRWCLPVWLRATMARQRAA